VIERRNVVCRIRGSSISHSARRLLWRLSLVVGVLAAPAALRGDTLVYDAHDGRRSVEGTLVARTGVEVLFLARNGRMHLLDAARVLELEATEEKPKPLTKKELMAELRSEFGPRFDVLETRHYLVCYNTDTAFARSCGTLFEKLHSAFCNYFKQRGFKLSPCEQALVAVVFATEHEFLQYADRELGKDMAANVIGFYSMLTNRMSTYDMLANRPRAGLGNVAGVRRPQGPRGIDAFAEANIATVIHEATHQLAYNTGFHQRFSDNPLWLAEGMAMFFEAPNRQAGDWKAVGEINRPRLELFHKEFLLGGQQVNIKSLVRDDVRLRDKDQALLAYSESWSLTYFLMKTRREQFYEYLRILAKKPALAQDKAEQRLADFRNAFGDDLAKLEEDFVRYMRTLR
jgi:hypothetical protein